MDGLYLEYLECARELLFVCKVVAEDDDVPAGFGPDVAEAVVGEAAHPRPDHHVHAAVRPRPTRRTKAHSYSR